MLNHVSLDGDVIIKRGAGGGTGGSGGGSSTPSRPKWTGHADAEGLRAIGWTDEDIAYYQANGVNWNEEDDEYHKVSDDNKALYGVLTANNISTYKDRIVYLPKIDTSSKTSMQYMFDSCHSLVSIPKLDTANVTDMEHMFSSCYSLVSVPLLDTSNVTSMSGMFSNCYTLVSIPQLDTGKVMFMSNMFSECRLLVSVPLLDTSNVTSMSYTFSHCYSLVSIPQLDTGKVMVNGDIIRYCYSLVCIRGLDSKGSYQDWSMPGCDSIRYLYIKNLKKTCKLASSALLSKESLLYIINNEAATSAITITLHSYAYERLATDPDIVAALTNHPNISLAK